MVVGRAGSRCGLATIGSCWLSECTSLTALHCTGLKQLATVGSCWLSYSTSLTALKVWLCGQLTRIVETHRHLVHHAVTIAASMVPRDTRNDSTTTPAIRSVQQNTATHCSTPHPTSGCDLSHRIPSLHRRLVSTPRSSSPAGRVPSSINRSSSPEYSATAEAPSLPCSLRSRRYHNSASSTQVT